jgi:FdhD protein
LSRNEAAVIPSSAHQHAPGPGIVETPVQKVNGTNATPEADVLAVEEPLEIRLGLDRQGQRTHRAISVTMRTPGHDLELAAGFLFTEGIIRSAAEIEQLRHCGRAGPGGSRNVVRVELKPRISVDLARLERHFYTTSSCGVCGKTALEAVRVGRRPPRLTEGQPVIEPNVIHRLPDVLRAAQAVFDQTGGLHAAGLFDARGTLLCLREDVGRHNAVDKLIGSQVLEGQVPLSDRLLLLSGRASFELVQKAMMAGIPVLAAVGAPSSLAVDLARDSGMTVLGFVRNGRFNIYTDAGRIRS